MKTDKNIFSTSLCISSTMLERYANNELSNIEKNNIEKHLIDCNICTDELEGLLIINQKNINSGVIDELNNKIDKKTKKNNKYLILKVAASVVSIIVVSLLVLIYLNKEKISVNKVVGDLVEKQEIYEQKVLEEKAREEDTELSNESEKKSEISKISKNDIIEDINTNTDILKRNINESQNKSKDRKQLEGTDDFIDTNVETEIVDKEVTSVSTTRSSTVSNEENTIVYGTSVTKADNNKDQIIVADELDDISTGKNTYFSNNLSKIASAEKAPARTKEKAKTENKKSLEQEIDFDKSNDYAPSTAGFIPSQEIDSTYIHAKKLYDNEKYELSIIEFSKIILNPLGENYHNALWYKSQALIKINKIEDAKQILKFIADDKKNPYQKGAKSLLKKYYKF